MHFKIKNTSYKISFSFFALLLLVLTLDQNRNFLFLFLFAILHELVHLFFIYRFSIPPERVTLTIFGANIKRGVISAYNINSEIIINVSAPVFNLITGAVFYLLYIFFACDYLILNEIFQVNLVLGLFNLIPFHTFDGGNALKYIIIKYFNNSTAEKITTCVSLIITVVFSFVTIYIFLNYQHNFSLLIMCFYMFLSIIFKKENSLDY